jgi:hypothetical protein
MHTTRTTAESRIPASLQAVFLASNQGVEVTKAPPSGVGSKTFQIWVPQRRYLGNLFSKWGKRNTRRTAQKTVAPASEATAPSNDLNSPLPTSHTAQKRALENAEAIADSTVLTIQHTEPQDFLNELLVSRGYSIDVYPSLTSAYYSAPTTLQQASYHTHLIDLVRQNNMDAFRAVMQSKLVSANPCNSFGEVRMTNGRRYLLVFL